MPTGELDAMPDAAWWVASIHERPVFDCAMDGKAMLMAKDLLRANELLVVFTSSQEELLVDVVDWVWRGVLALRYKAGAPGPRTHLARASHIQKT
jgi:hypothetical protein